jgi:glycosyltransferase involved in cell wall biosynthesis
MKIAILTSSYPRFSGDGTAPFIKSFAENYAKLGHSVFVIAAFDPLVKGDNDLDGVKVVRFRYIWPDALSVMGHARSLKGDAKLSFLSYLLIPFFLFFGILALYRICRKEKIEVIHANWVLPNGPIALVVSRMLRIPYVLSLHGSDIFVSRMNIVFSRIARMVFRRASSVTACSEFLRDTAVTLGSPKEKTILLPYGVDPSKFSPDVDSQDLREKLAISNSDILVVAIGRLVYKKGFDVLISAWNEIFQKFPTARLLIGGDGPLLNKLKKQAIDLGIETSIIFSGRIDWQDVPGYLASGDIFVLPSVNDRFGNVDGLPNVLLEAMSCGTACVASNIGGVKLVIQNWQNGVIVEENSSVDLARCLEILVSNKQLCDTLGDAARISILQNHKWQDVAKVVISLFSNAIKISKHSYKPKRLGVLYRKHYLELFLRDKHALDTENVLDVGSYDGY